MDLLLCCAGGGAGGGGSIGPVDWTNINSDTAGVTNRATLTVTGTIMIGATVTGIGALGYVKNGTSLPFSGDFPVSNGDTLMWEVKNLTGTVNAAGTVTVTDDTNSVTLDAFTYVVRPPE